MTITYTWSIPQNGLITMPTLDGQTNVVTAVMYSVVATDGIHTERVQRIANVKYVAGEPFTQFSDLTEDKVIEWVKASQPNLVENTQKMLDKQIANSINPPVRPTAKPNPWSTSE
jgi:hypothetical protein